MTKILLITGLVFIIYGYLCRLAGLYFFWESKSIGWWLLLIGIIGILSGRIKIKKAEKKKTVLEKIGIGFILFIFLMQGILILVIPNSEAFAVAKAHLVSDEAIRAETGEIEGFGLIPIGSVEKTTDDSGTYGSAEINLTLKGSKKFKDLTVYVVKYPDKTGWEVFAVE